MSDTFVEDGQIYVKVPKPLVNSVRAFVQDYPEVNRLIEDGEESSDQQIARFVVDVIDEWNATPPLLYPDLSPSVAYLTPALRIQIVNGTIVRLMKSIMLKLARNDMPYTAGNVTVQVDAVWRNLQPIIQDMEIQFKQFRQDYKIAQNVKIAWGSAHSELLGATYQTGRDGFIMVGL